MKQRVLHVLAGVLLAASFIGLGFPLQAKAENAYLRIAYDGEEGAWFSSLDGETWTEGIEAVETHVQNGDTILIDADNATDGLLVLNLNVKPKELAVTGGAHASVTTQGVGTAYATRGSLLALHSDADKIVAVPDAVVQVEGNVGEVEAQYEVDKNLSLEITGTIGKVNVLISHTPRIIYNVAAGKFNLNEEDNLDMSYDDFSFEPTASNETQTDTSSASAQTAAADTSSEKQLDKVPKTGSERNPAWIFFACFAVCGLGGVYFWKKA